MKKLILSSLLVFLFYFGYSQENKLIMSSEVEAYMSNNVKAGKVAEDGVLSVFIITYQERPIKDQEKEGITNALKKIDGFEKIAINTSANTFFITTIKKRGSPQYPEIKAILAELGFRIMKSEEELKLEKL